jgi:hypothetical protein
MDLQVSAPSLHLLLSDRMILKNLFQIGLTAASMSGLAGFPLGGAGASPFSQTALRFATTGAGVTSGNLNIRPVPGFG